MKKSFHDTKYLSILLIFCISIVSFSTILRAEDQMLNRDCITISYVFEQPLCDQKMVDGILSTVISLPNNIQVGNPGEPDIPSYPVRLLLPYGHQISEIQVIPDTKKLLGVYDIAPISEALPMLPETSSEQKKPLKNPSIYTRNTDFPGSLYEHIGTYQFRGYTILLLNLHPVQYNPVTKETTFYSNMDVTLITEPISTDNILYRQGKDTPVIREMIDNPLVLSTYPVSSTQSRETYELLILTTDQFKDAFIPLKEAHDAQGVSTTIKTLTDAGGDTPELIREYITTCYTDYQISFVLIGGDEDIIPIKKLWAEVNGDTTDHLPSDIYYACLDGPYNYDGDAKWGEPHDGEDGGDVDLLAEVSIGRAPIGTINEVNNFVSKTTTYMSYTADDPIHRKLLMLGEQLDGSTYGDDAMNNIISTSIPADMYSIDTLYDGDHHWSKNELITKINSDIHMINHLGHSSDNFNLKLYNSDVDALTNEQLFFVYTQGCYPGALDIGDCIAEHFTVKTPYAAFAGVWNSRYGWYSSQVTNGPSQKFHRQFVKGLLKENKETLGETNQYSKEYFVNYINQNAMRWCYYETNLFGDPAVVFHLPGTTQTDLECMGSISWTKIKPGATVNSSFTLKNNGDYGSQLSWKITEQPSWGTWTFTPSNGQGLTPEDGTKIISVSVIAPDEKNKEFTGTIKVVNTKNSSDFCIIDVSLSTPLNIQTSHPIIQMIINRFVQRFPMSEKIISRIPAFAQYINA